MGTETDSGGMLLFGLLSMFALLAFLYNPGLPAYGLHLSTTVIYQENAPQTLPQASLI